MGTASTMTSMAEALGTTLTGAAAIPAADSRRRALAHVTGRRIVQMVQEDLRLSQILTPAAFHNAIATLHALGGSTNAVITCRRSPAASASTCRSSASTSCRERCRSSPTSSPPASS
jgi:dihydroxyacid dehydratase/phosphogluconate dehydratase